MNRLLVFIFFLMFTSLSFSQSDENINVNKDIDLVKVYTQVVKEGYGTPQIYKELANAHYFRSEYESSKKWFEKLFSEGDNKEELLLYRYQQSLKALGQYSEKNEYITLSGTN